MEELEQDELNDRLAGADHVPVHHPAGASRVADSTSFSSHPLFHPLTSPHLISSQPFPFPSFLFLYYPHSPTENRRRGRRGTAQRATSLSRDVISKYLASLHLHRRHHHHSSHSFGVCLFGSRLVHLCLYHSVYHLS